MTAQELDDLLRQVRMRGSMSSTYLVLNDEQRAAIASALLPAINQRIAQAKASGT